jgi:hypothetical protein
MNESLAWKECNNMEKDELLLEMNRLRERIQELGVQKGQLARALNYQTKLNKETLSSSDEKIIELQDENKELCHELSITKRKKIRKYYKPFFGYVTIPKETLQELHNIISEIQSGQRKWDFENKKWQRIQTDEWCASQLDKIRKGVEFQ